MNWAPRFIDRPVEIFFTLDEWIVIILTFFFTGAISILIGLPVILSLMPPLIAGIKLRTIRRKKGRGYILQNIVYRILFMHNFFPLVVKEPHKNRRFSP
ncbi:MAG: hypothetical protein AB1488_06610 [Nitrospirota bacterium]